LLLGSQCARRGHATLLIKSKKAACGTGSSLKRWGSWSAYDGPLAHDRITYSCDALGRVTKRGIDGTGDSSSYDSLGRVTSHSDPLGTFALSYLGQTGQVVQRPGQRHRLRLSGQRPQRAGGG